MRVARLPVVVLVLSLAAVSATPVRADSANNIVRFGAAWLSPDTDTTTNFGFGDVRYEADQTTGVFAGYERRIIPWLGFEFNAMYAKPDISVTPEGSPTTVQSEQTLTGTIGLNFHVFARSRFDAYLGLYAAYTNFDQVFTSSTGFGGVAGIDIGLTKSGLALVISARYTKMDADFNNIPGTASYDTLIGQVGLGWRF